MTVEKNDTDFSDLESLAKKYTALKASTGATAPASELDKPVQPDEIKTRRSRFKDTAVHPRTAKEINTIEQNSLVIWLAKLLAIVLALIVLVALSTVGGLVYSAHLLPDKSTLLAMWLEVKAIVQAITTAGE